MYAVAPETILRAFIALEQKAASIPWQREDGTWASHQRDLKKMHVAATPWDAVLLAAQPR